MNALILSLSPSIILYKDKKINLKKKLKGSEVVR